MKTYYLGRTLTSWAVYVGSCYLTDALFHVTNIWGWLFVAFVWSFLIPDGLEFRQLRR